MVSNLSINALDALSEVTKCEDFKGIKDAKERKCYLM